MSNVETEMSPEEQAAAHAEVKKLFDETITSNMQWERVIRADGGYVNLSRDHKGRSFISDIPENAGHVTEDGTYIDSHRYAISDAGELIDDKTGRPDPAKARELAEAIKAGTLDFQ